MGREKKRYWVYVLIALIGLVGFSLAKYITSVKDVGAPKPAAKYPDKKSKGQTKSITVPKAKPGEPVYEYKPQAPSEVTQPMGSQTPEVELRTVISEDKRVRGDAPSARKLPSDEREADFTPKPQAKAPPPIEWFKDGKALDDEPEEETPAEKLQRADDLSVRAVKRAAEAREFCDCELLVEAFELADEAAALVSQAAAEAEKIGNMGLARQAYHMANNVVGAAVMSIAQTRIYCAKTSARLTIATCFCDCGRIREALELADRLASLVSKARARAKATGDINLQDACEIGYKVGAALRDTTETCRHCAWTSVYPVNVACLCDCELTQESLRLADELAILASEVAAEAEEAGGGELALTQCAYDMAKAVEAALSHVTETCKYCARTSMETEIVACSERNRARAEEIARFNAQTIEATFSAGALPGPPEPFEEPEAPGDGAPVEDELPIRDHEQPPASQV